MKTNTQSLIYFVERIHFGNAGMFIIRNEENTEQYSGPFLEQLKAQIRAKHLPKGIEIEFFEERDRPAIEVI